MALRSKYSALTVTKQKGNELPITKSKKEMNYQLQIIKKLQELVDRGGINGKIP
jgi:hypothetical protein